ncbi:MAG: thiamine pyrophosphate-dependent enzyme [Thermodesulfobacteriota bacterium]
MKQMGAMLLTRESFSEIVMGNTAIVRAMVEAGTRVVTSYPGSPTPEIADAIGSIPRKDRPFYFEFSTNEKVATEVAYGAAVNGRQAAVFFKSVGLNVAADTFVQLSMMNIIGGLVVIVGDDPGANSSQNEQDNRHYARMSYMPVLEPADPGEVYRFYLSAAALSRQKQMPVMLRLTTHVCHAKQRVAFGSYRPEQPDDTPRFSAVNGPYVPIAADVFPKKRKALKSLAEVAAMTETADWNRVVDNGNPDYGVITMGLPFLSLMEVISTGTFRPDILKLGMIHPAPRRLMEDFLSRHREVKILEELDDVLEKEAKAVAFDAGLRLNIIGKTDPEDWVGEYTPDKVRQVLQAAWPDLAPFRPEAPAARPQVPARPPQMCPGCGHRSAFHAIKQALSGSEITVADIGCHTLGYLPPYRVGELLMCMGASTGMGAGLSLFNDTRRVVAFLGDSTFFHAGLPGVINALFNNHRLTLIVMENGTTAMTGHQDHAGSGRNFNHATDRIPVRRLLEGLGVRHIFEADTYQQAKLTDLVRQALSVDGFSVVIARHPCMLKFMREQRRRPDFKSRRVAVDQEKCRRLHTCVEEFACPTFTRAADGAVTIHPDLCIGDGSCRQTCKAEAVVGPETVA